MREESGEIHSSFLSQPNDLYNHWVKFTKMRGIGPKMLILGKEKELGMILLEKGRSLLFYSNPFGANCNNVFFLFLLFFSLPFFLIDQKKNVESEGDTDDFRAIFRVYFTGRKRGSFLSSPISGWSFSFKKLLKKIEPFIYLFIFIFFD